MNQNTNINPEPKAWIATDGSRKKIKNDKNVYLKDQEKFEIELFNPTTSKVLAKINLNGNPISSFWFSPESWTESISEKVC